MSHGVFIYSCTINSLGSHKNQEQEKLLDFIKPQNTRNLSPRGLDSRSARNQRGCQFNTDLRETEKRLQLHKHNEVKVLRINVRPTLWLYHLDLLHFFLDHFSHKKLKIWHRTDTKRQIHGNIWFFNLTRLLFDHKWKENKLLMKFFTDTCVW